VPRPGGHPDVVAALAHHHEHLAGDVEIERAAALGEQARLVLGVGVLAQELGAHRSRFGCPSYEPVDVHRPVVALGLLGGEEQRVGREHRVRIGVAIKLRERGDAREVCANGDTPIVDEKVLREFYDSLQQGALIVNRVGGSDDKWNDVAKLNLTYCISNSFGANKAGASRCRRDGSVEESGQRSSMPPRRTRAASRATPTSCSTFARSRVSRISPVRFFRAMPARRAAC
jgi:hypothetical protein